MRRLFIIILLLLLFAATLFFSCFNNTALVTNETVSFYKRLKDTLPALGYNDRLLVISTKRHRWQNNLLQVRGAAKNSRHLYGDAIDFIVFDINRDGKSDSNDVRIAYQLLDKKIIQSRGGIGTYTRESSFFDRQMIHIDARGIRARWHR